MSVGMMTRTESRGDPNSKTESPGDPNIKKDDFGYDAPPMARQDLHENDSLWNGMDSKGPTKIDISEYGDGFSKKP